MSARRSLPRQVWVVVFGVALIGALAWVATQSGPLAPIPVTVVEVVAGTVSPALFGIGTVEARRAYFIGPTAAGRVRRVLVDVGDTVTAGQLLAEMEPVDLDTRVASTVAAVDRGRSVVAAADAQVRDARSRQELATTEARRTDGPRQGGRRQPERGGRGAQGSSSPRRRRWSAAEAALAVARRDLPRLDADLGGAQQQRANLRLVAPVDGVVTARDAEPGSTVVAGPGRAQAGGPGQHLDSRPTRPGALGGPRGWPARPPSRGGPIPDSR